MSHKFTMTPEHQVPEWFDRTRPLPDKPSDLLELALNDLTKVEVDPQYRVRMWQWHGPEHGLTPDRQFLYCGVCLAGSVLAKSYSVPVSECVAVNLLEGSGDEEFDRFVGKLRAIDALREGDVRRAFWLMDYPRDVVESMDYIFHTRTIREYDGEYPEFFHEDIQHLIEDLRKEGY